MRARSAPTSDACDTPRTSLRSTESPTAPSAAMAAPSTTSVASRPMTGTSGATFRIAADATDP